MRRQYGVGGVQPAGSGRSLRLDPLSLPACFEARDARTDSGSRHIEINRERVLVRRAVRGISMTVQVRIREFLGIACRETDDGQILILIHRDPSLSIPLLVSGDGEEIERAWMQWSDLFVLPQIEEDNDIHEPAPRRRRRNAIRDRRPKFLVRRRPGHALQGTPIHRDEREIIARH